MLYVPIDPVYSVKKAHPTTKIISRRTKYVLRLPNTNRNEKKILSTRSGGKIYIQLH
jgi:hypothetical protein